MNYLTLLLFGLISVAPFAASPGDVVISEIAWMGTTASSSDEWIELRNNTAQDIDLTGWTLNASDGSPVITLVGTISANGYYLLERTDDTSVADVVADRIYTGALGNTGEVLELRDDGGQVIDSVDSWYAGDSANRFTMERIDPTQSGNQASNWATSTSSYPGGNGTPRAANSASSPEPSVCNYPSGLEIIAINIGQGDATLIATPTALMLADAGESNWNSHHDADKVDEVIKARYGANCRTLNYVLISHFHLDHLGYIQLEENDDEQLLNDQGGIWTAGENLKNPDFKGGLAYLANGLGYEIQTTLWRDHLANNPNIPPEEGGSKTYRNWSAYLASPNGQSKLHPVTAQLGTSQIDLGSVGNLPVEVDIIQVDALTPSNPVDGCDPATYFGAADNLLRGDRTGDSIPPSENDLSVAFILSYGDFQMFIGGDTSGENYESQWGYRYHDTETCLANDPIIQQKYGGHLEVLRVNHHGSSHSTNQALLDVLSPQVSIFSVGDNNTFGHPNQEVLDRILVKTIGENGGMVFMTESGASATSANDLCYSSDERADDRKTRRRLQWCAQVVDGEFPTSTESNETGDANVVITVGPSKFTVQGDPGAGAWSFPSTQKSRSKQKRR